MQIEKRCKKRTGLGIAMALSIALFACLPACKKSSGPQGLAVTRLTPSTGPYSLLDTISGSGFSTEPDGNQVLFNNVPAVVQQATSTQLIVVVPKGAGTGKVTVRTGVSTATGPVFNYVLSPTVSTLAGGIQGFLDAPGNAARFDLPYGLTVGPGNILYVADLNNNAIRAVVTLNGGNLFAGDVYTVTGNPAKPGVTDGILSVASFNSPIGIVADAAGNLYVSEERNERIRRISLGTVGTFAGGTTGFADGVGTAAEFHAPSGLALDSKGNLIVADAENQRIRKISSVGVVTTIAGTGVAGYTDGPAATAQFRDPSGLAIDGQDNIYVADLLNEVIRKITPDGTVSTVAGVAGAKGSNDGPGATAEFNYPAALVMDARGNLLVADALNNLIRKISPFGIVSTFAGSRKVHTGSADGPGNQATFDGPVGIVIDGLGNIYISEENSGEIRKIVME